MHGNCLTSYLQVYKGFIKYPNFKTEVAIKTCKRSNGYDDIEREARVFMKLKERNMNIVNLLGSQTNILKLYLDDILRNLPSH